MFKKNGQPQPKVEKMSSEEETKLQEKSKRTAEDVKKLFMETYGFEENDPKLEKLVERELAHSKVVSKLIGQKIHYREKANKTDKEEVRIVDEEDETDIRSIERTKAVNKVIAKISEKYEDLDSSEVLEKIKEVYKEKGDETLRGDFEKKLWQSFWVAYPDKYKENVREKAAQEDNIPEIKKMSTVKTKPKTFERKFFKKQGSPKDWFIKK